MRRLVNNGEGLERNYNNNNNNSYKMIHATQFCLEALRENTSNTQLFLVRIFPHSD